VMKVAKVVTNLSLDREFDYRIPPALAPRVRVGSRVRVPFGKGREPRVGYVVALADDSPYASSLKDIEGVEGEREQIPPNLVKLARWMADYYCCSREQAVRAVLPAVVRGGKMSRKTHRVVELVPDVDLAEALAARETRAKKQAAALHALIRLGRCSVATLRQDAGVSDAVIRALVDAKVVSVTDEEVDRDPFASETIVPTTALNLTDEQAKALAAIVKSVEAADAEIVLLHGVTGSGKTEVYLQAIDYCLERGLDAIVLVPEISLTPQTTDRFRSRFGEIVSVLHSGLSDGERFDEWIRVREGRARIVVGARSALFAPFANLGLIVVDEEHETTYKQDEAPRYNARDIAVVRGKMEKTTVVLGSATPSLESFGNCEKGKYTLAELRERVDNCTMPVMELVDMRAEAMLRGGAQIFSRRLQDLIRGRLERGEQVILFLNRRGYATQMLCTQCGFVATCPHCNLSYTYHRKDQSLICHLCGDLLRAYERCPQCNDTAIRYTGLGTEKVESVAAKLFPSATIARMDSDTMTRKDSYRTALNAFRAGKTQMLIGTQMIAKGLHFPKVTLVGIIFADLSLHIPDFRAGERTFQLLTQVAGRAGRGDVPGHVIVQSYTPFHMALQYALNHDVYGFVDEELEMRDTLEFPPYVHMAIVHFRGRAESATADFAAAFAENLRPLLPPGTVVAGPAPSPIAKVRDLFRYQLTLRTRSILALSRLLRRFAVGQRTSGNAVDVVVDIDPMSLM